MKARNRFTQGGSATDRACWMVHVLLALAWCYENKVSPTTVNLVRVIEYAPYGLSADELSGSPVSKTSVQRVRRILNRCRQLRWVATNPLQLSPTEWELLHCGWDVISQLTGFRRSRVSYHG